MGKHTDAIRKHLGRDESDPIEREISEHLSAIDKEHAELVGALKGLFMVVNMSASDAFRASIGPELENARALLSRIGKE